MFGSVPRAGVVLEEVDHLSRVGIVLERVDHGASVGAFLLRERRGNELTCSVSTEEEDVEIEDVPTLGGFPSGERPRLLDRGALAVVVWAGKTEPAVRARPLARDVL